MNEPQQMTLPFVSPRPMPTQWKLNEAGFVEGQRVHILSFGTAAGLNHYFFTALELAALADALHAKAIGLAIVAS